MKPTTTALSLAFAALLVIAAIDVAAVPGGFNGNLEYTGGPNECASCHLLAFYDWLTHGHSRILAALSVSTSIFRNGFESGDISEWPSAVPRATASPWLDLAGGTLLGLDKLGDRGHTADVLGQGFPLPTHDREVYHWDNVLLVVGASKRWRSHPVGLDGYFLTLNGRNQYDWAVGEWVDYNADVAMKPFDCGPCHSTGYDPDGTYFNDVLGIPGIVGDFSHLNVTCEACHGPGAAHAAAPALDNIIPGEDIAAADCGVCHTRGADPGVVLASGGFIRNHEQYPEMLAGAHAIFDVAFGGCGGCHHGHLGRREGFSSVISCETCHPAQAAQYEGSSMHAAGVSCIDCHMGRATRSARANGPYEGDVWTHLFRIDSSADYDMFHRDGMGNTVSAKSALSLEFACFRCHAAADKAAFAAIGDGGIAYHVLGK